MTPAQADTRIIDICPPGWCWSRLAEADEGVLSYVTPHGRVALAVPYAVHDQQITIPLAVLANTAWAPTDTEATLEVIGVAAENQRWLVRAIGWAQPAGVPGAPASSWLVLLPVRVRGFYETSIGRAAAAGLALATPDLQGAQP